VRWCISALAGLFLVSAVGPTAGAGALSAAPVIRTVAALQRPGSLSSPSGVALDAAGDLFVADTDHCRVLFVPDHSGVMYGLHVKSRHAYTLAGSHCGAPHGLGFPTGVAVDRHGDVFIAEAADDRVVMVPPGGRAGPHALVTVAGTGAPGYSGNGLAATKSALDAPTGVAVDAAGDLFIADTANCRVRMVPAHSGVHYGQQMVTGHLYNLVGTGVCGSALGDPALSSQIWNPVAVAVDPSGDLYIAGNGDQTVVEVPVRSGDYYGTSIGAGDAQVIIGLVGDGNTPYLADGLSATSVASELNDPEGLAVSSSGVLFVTDGTMHCIRVVPNMTGDLFGRVMDGGDMYTLAGALPGNNSLGIGDGTKWILTKMGIPYGIAVTASGATVFSDQGTDQVREIG
jgi:glucose/arabinose dehydrogenase